MNEHSLSLKYELCLKSIETEAVYTKIKMNNKWNVDFLQNTSCVEKVLLYFDLLTRPKMPFQGDAPEGGDTFWWQLWEEIAWAEIGWWNGTS